MSDELSLYDQLKSQVDKAHWKLLEDHHKRGALLFVDPKEDMIEIAAAIASDNVQRIKELLDAKLLTRTTEEHAKQWDSQDNLEFNFVIIQPYVLVQHTSELKEVQ